MKVESKSFRTAEGEVEFYQAYDNSLSLWNVLYESIFIETQLGRTHLIAAGPENAEPLLLIHGFGFGAPMWYSNIEMLASEYRVYAVDVIGEFNKSDMEKSIESRNDYADWIAELLNQLHIEKITLIGHSNGGWHSLNFAIHHPERVKRLVLLAPAASFIPFHMQFGIRLLLINIIRNRSFIYRYFMKWIVAKGNDVHDYLFEQFYQGLIHFQWKHKILRPSVFKDSELMKINVPVCFMVGDKEVIYSHHKVVKHVRNTIPHAQTVLVENAGHALSIEKADVVNRTIQEFLRNNMHRVHK
ncbi:alpha/beta fold hydrolase [Ureibacillus sp. MALMAid1270]|uniref:alpha/beta fold hydrolase n=1 Tax=Ureibacillus sp. MALMAid1270 TaxID=3411629 RepID=UPI003BA59683